MHTYIYDSFVSSKKHSSIINSLETRLTDMGVSGRICRLSKLRSLHDIVKQELRRQPKTLVVVGNDWIIHQVLNLIIDFKVPLGIIPVGDDKDNLIASGLGLTLKEAPQILSARRILEMDLGVINKKLFLRNAAWFVDNVKIDIDNNYSIRTSKVNMELINFLPADVEYMGQNPSPEDGRLNLLIKKPVKKIFKKEESETAICFDRIDIDGAYQEITLDGVARVSNIEEVGILPQALQIIVGKDRNF